MGELPGLVLVVEADLASGRGRFYLFSVYVLLAVLFEVCVCWCDVRYGYW